MRRLAVLIAAAVLLVTPALGRLRTSPIERLLMEAGSAAELRARLLAFAAADTTAPTDAGEALTLVGRSYERAAQPDSAIALYRRSLDVRRGHEERVRLIEVLLRRRRPGDVEAALDEIRRGRQDIASASGDLARDYPRLEGWAMVLADHPDSARRLFAPFKQDLMGMPTWRYRMARAELKGGDPREVFSLLRTLAVDSRTADRDVMEAIRQIASETGVGRRLEDDVEREIATRDRNEELALWGIGGRRVTFRGADGFRLGGVWFAPERKGRARAAIVLMPPGESIADRDSVVTGLRRAGLAVMMMDVRGSGWSVDEACPLPDTWRGREDLLTAYAARDVKMALRALATVTPLDTSRYLVAAVGARAPIAAQAAALDSRIAGLVLASPEVDPLERGPMQAWLVKRRLPTYYQFSPGDRPDREVIDALFRAGAEKSSRIVESNLLTRGPRRFQLDPEVPARLARWVRVTFPTPASPAARRSTPRKG